MLPGPLACRACGAAQGGAPTGRRGQGGAPTGTLGPGVEKGAPRPPRDGALSPAWRAHPQLCPPRTTWRTPHCGTWRWSLAGAGSGTPPLQGRWEGTWCPDVTGMQGAMSGGGEGGREARGHEGGPSSGQQGHLQGCRSAPWRRHREGGGTFWRRVAGMLRAMRPTRPPQPPRVVQGTSWGPQAGS